MIKKIILEKLYLLFIIILIGGYSAMSMLTTEHTSILGENKDSLLLKILTSFLLISACVCSITNTQYLKWNRIGKTLLFLSIYMAVWRVICLSPTVGLLSYIYHPMRDILIIVLFTFSYIIASKSEELSNFYSTGMFIALLITAFYYYKNWSFANEIDQAHLGTAYYALFLLPTILLTPSKWLRYVSTIIVGVIILSSFKRGGLIALVLGLVTYFFVKEVLFQKKFGKLIWFVVILVVLFIVLMIADNAMGNVLSTRLANISEDGGSGRDQVWKATWYMIKTTLDEQIIFGHGFNAVLRDSPLGLSAHNDFLEMLYDYGIVGFIPYLVLHFSLIKYLFRAIKAHDKRSPVIAFAYVMFFVLSMISHVIVYPWSALMAIFWGIMLPSQTNVIIEK